MVVWPRSLFALHVHERLSYQASDIEHRGVQRSLALQHHMHNLIRPPLLLLRRPQHLCCILSLLRICSHRVAPFFLIASFDTDDLEGSHSPISTRFRISSRRWSYEQIADRIGSYAKHVERHYIAYRMVRQAQASELPGYQYIKFGVLMRALQTRGVSEFLGVTYPNDPEKSRSPIPRRKTTPFAQFISWAFGTDQTESVLGDSRNLSKFGQILSSPEAIRYLRTASTPRLDRAWQKSGGEHESLLDSLWAAADMLEEAVPTAPDYKDNVDVRSAVEKCVRLTGLILRDFEDIRKKYAELFCNDRAATKRARR